MAPLVRLFEEALKKQMMVFPVLTPGEIIQNTQLKDRGFWLEVPHPEKNISITYPGFFIKASKAPCSVRGRAPLVGEHNLEVYEKELGFSRDTIIALKEGNII